MTKATHVSLRLDATFRAELERAAAAEYRDITSFVKIAIRDRLDKVPKPKNPRKK